MPDANKPDNWQLIRDGIFRENTIFGLAISLCPALAVTTNLKNGLFMGIAVLFVQVMVNLTISAMRRTIHPGIILPVLMLVISVWVTVVNLLIDAFVPEVYKEIGLYIQLIAAFSSVLARAEMFALRNRIVPSLSDGIGMGLGFLIALVLVSAFREAAGRGSLWGVPLIDAGPLLIAVLPAGGFFAVGILMALFNWGCTRFGAKGLAGRR